MNERITKCGGGRREQRSTEVSSLGKLMKVGTHEDEKHTGSKLMSVTLDMLSLTSYCTSRLEISSK